MTTLYFTDSEVAKDQLQRHENRAKQKACDTCENTKYHGGNDHCHIFSEKPAGECPYYHE